jgi:hypothetical protein
MRRRGARTSRRALGRRLRSGVRPSCMESERIRSLLLIEMGIGGGILAVQRVLGWWLSLVEEAFFAVGGVEVCGLSGLGSRCFKDDCGMEMDPVQVRDGFPGEDRMSSECRIWGVQKNDMLEFGAYKAYVSHVIEQECGEKSCRGRSTRARQYVRD